MGVHRLLGAFVVAMVLVSATGAAATAAAAPSAGTGESVAPISEPVPATERAREAVASDGTVASRDRSQVEAPVDVDAPETSNEFLAAFRELSDRESLETYSEFEVIRTQAIVAVQAGEFDTADRERMRAVLRTLVRFDQAYRAAADGDLSGGLQTARETRETLSTLESAGGTQYSSLAGVALDRFFRSLGEQFEERSRQGISTPERVAALERAGEAYRLGGESERFAEVTVRAESLASEYERDRAEMNESIAAAQAFGERCGETCTSPVAAVTSHSVGVFSLYSDARAANAETSEAVRIAQSHNLGERTREVQAIADDSSGTLLSLAIGSALVVFAYALVLAIPTMFVASRMSQWAIDRRAASVGSILTPRPAEVTTDGGE
jgi:hypothetical protein